MFAVDTKQSEFYGLATKEYMSATWLAICIDLSSHAQPKILLLLCVYS